MSSLLRWLAAHALLVCALLGASGVAAAQPSGLLLSDASRTVPVWPALRMLNDPAGTLDFQDAINARQLFEPPHHGP